MARSVYTKAGYAIYWKFPSATERNSLVPVASEEGRLAWQANDDSVWMLKATNPLTWLQIGGGDSEIDGGSFSDTYVTTTTAVDGGTF